MLTSLYKELNSPLSPLPTGLEPKLPQWDDIRAVIFDIYGTLVLSGTGDISIAQSIDKESELRGLFGESAGILAPSIKLSEIFYDLIKEDHALSKAKGASYPEVDILEIWARFFQRLKSHGYNGPTLEGEALKDFAIRFECAVNPVWPMPGIEGTLKKLDDEGFKLGIVSNAQFYTPVMMEGFMGQTIEQLGFQSNLCVWSYQERLGKPSVELFEKLNAALEARGIQPSQALYVGNDMLNDIWTANQAGLKTALFAGDRRSLRLRESDERCKDLEPDAILTELTQLLQLI